MLQMEKSLIAGAGQGLGGRRGLVDRGHPSVGRHDPLLIVDAAHVRLVDELRTALEPGDHFAVDLGRFHLPEVGRYDAEDEHDLCDILIGGKTESRGRRRQDGVSGCAQIVRDDTVGLAAEVRLVDDLVAALDVIGAGDDFVQPQGGGQGNSDR